MRFDKPHIRAMKEPWDRDVAISIQATRDGRLFVLKELPDLEEVKEGAFVSGAMTLHYDHAQVLIDDLWMAGLRPSEGTGSAGSLAATEKHLNDMRKIVAKKLDVTF